MSKKQKWVKSIIFFPNGNIAVFNKDGLQVGELQGSYVLGLISKAIALGYKVDKHTQINLPNGRRAKYLQEYDNYEIINHE